ncbi:MAG: hypothetical protein LKE64_12080 [Solobacterium sp.]|jgi:hypothetical protein|nr:hypothetical protein [Solobacterium sp.]MCH4047995.1 hypothetical protein [Solobacterium sp.]MCH4075419.1 hypothetical protein [Solobacterium sp.]MCI1313731.1 hypothetical protein [Solobacterium sp.]MCI1407128.1 hypothetical protein [Solobacterium sp.]
MADETTKAPETGNESQTAAEPEKTFTQDEVNRMIGDRLAREREKYSGYDEMKEKAQKYDEAQEANKTELQKATEKAAKLQQQVDAMTKAENLRQIREKVSADTGVPANLLTADDEETCTAQAKAILEFAKPQSYPNVSDSGEVQHTSSKSAAQQFADWFNQSLKH